MRGVHVGIVILLLFVTAFGAYLSPTAADGRFWNEYFCIGSEQCATGDFNGDGRDDILAFIVNTQSEPSAGDVYVALSNGSMFNAGQKWHNQFCIGVQVCLIGDVNGDNRDDLIALNRGTGDVNTGVADVWVALSTGTSFGTAYFASGNFCYGSQICLVGDVNDDGRDDLIAFQRGNINDPLRGDVWVGLSNGSGFGAAQKWVWAFDMCIDAQECIVGDWNGDGFSDLAALNKGTGNNPAVGDVWISLSNGVTFLAAQLWDGYFCVGSEICRVGDFNGDGKTDMAAFSRGNSASPLHGDVWIGLSSGATKNPTGSGKWNDFFCVDSEICLTGDFNGDGKTDAAAFLRGLSNGLFCEPTGDVYVTISDGAALKE